MWRIRTLAAHLAAIATLLFAAACDCASASPPHRRFTSYYGRSPAFWGWEHGTPSIHGRSGRRRARLNRADASIVQADPRLRRNSDGDLAGALIQSPSSETRPLLDANGLPAIKDVPPVGYLHGENRRHRFLRRGF